MEFSAKLSNPLGAVLGEYLSEAHVRIIDAWLHYMSGKKMDSKRGDLQICAPWITLKLYKRNRARAHGRGGSSWNAYVWIPYWVSGIYVLQYVAMWGIL